MLSAIFFGIAICMMAFGILGIIRTHIVYQVRTYVLHASRFNYQRMEHVGYEALPSYDKMMWQLNKWRRDDWIKELPLGWREE